MYDLLFRPSPQQQAFFDFVAQPSGNGVLEAAAGSGKTTTLVKAAPRLSGSTFLGAFNKSIAAELDRRVRDETRGRALVTASTMHSAGFVAWKQRYPKAGLGKNKLRQICREILAHPRHPPAWEACQDYACSLIEYAQNLGLGLDDPRQLEDAAAWRAVSDHFDADRALPERRPVEAGIGFAQAVMQHSLERCPQEVTYGEMLYAPVYFGCRVQQYDTVLIDEAQDRTSLSLL
jgi:superfamily I DNA/RNA helicase